MILYFNRHLNSHCSLKKGIIWQSLLKNALFHCKNYPCDAIPLPLKSPHNFYFVSPYRISVNYTHKLLHFLTTRCLIGALPFLFPKHFLTSPYNDIFLRWFLESYLKVRFTASAWMTKIRDSHTGNGFGKVDRKWSTFYQEYTLIAMKVNYRFSTKKRTVQLWRQLCLESEVGIAGSFQIKLFYNNIFGRPLLLLYIFPTCPRKNLKLFSELIWCKRKKMAADMFGALWEELCSITLLTTPMVRNNPFSAQLSFTQRGWSATVSGASSRF